MGRHQQEEAAEEPVPVPVPSSPAQAVAARAGPIHHRCREWQQAVRATCGPPGQAVGSVVRMAVVMVRAQRVACLLLRPWKMLRPHWATATRQSPTMMMMMTMTTLTQLQRLLPLLLLAVMGTSRRRLAVSGKCPWPEHPRMVTQGFSSRRPRLRRPQTTRTQKTWSTRHC